jgi:hypothetical protein
VKKALHLTWNDLMIMSMSGFGDMDVAEYTNQVGDLAVPEVVKSNAKHEVVLGQQEVSEP